MVRSYQKVYDYIYEQLCPLIIDTVQFEFFKKDSLREMLGLYLSEYTTDDMIELITIDEELLNHLVKFIQKPSTRKEVMFWNIHSRRFSNKLIDHMLPRFMQTFRIIFNHAIDNFILFECKKKYSIDEHNLADDAERLRDLRFLSTHN